MARTKEPPPSSAMVLIQHVWDHNREATGFSWTRLNWSMYAAVKVAITAGLEFNRDDFIRMADRMRIHRWAGESNGEGWYSHAIKLAHPSAYQAYEAWQNRRPFIVDGERLHVEKQIRWDDDWWIVASFRDGYVNLIQREYDKQQRPRVTKRRRLTHADIRARNAALTKIKKATAAQQAAQQAQRERVEAIAKQLEADTARGETWYKLLKNGHSCHGGKMRWSLPKKLPNGEWRPGRYHEVPKETLRLCESGLHLTRVPAAWWSEGLEVYLAEYPSGAKVEIEGIQKAAVSQCRLLRRIEADELEALGCT